MNFIHFIILVLLILSCNSQVQKQQGISIENTKSLFQIAIRPPQGKLPNLKLSEIATDIKYIKLETSNEILLGNGLAYYSPDCEFIFVTSGGRIFQFNRYGKFIRNIGKIGKGPNEFILHRMDVDFQNKIIYIFPQWTQEILKFNFDGKPLGRIKNELIGYPALMRVLGDQLIFVNEINQFLRKDNKGGHMELYSFNPGLNKVNYYLPNPYHFSENLNTFSNTVNGQEHLEILKDIAYYKMQFCDTLYKIADGHINPFLFIDMGKFKYSIENSQLRKTDNREKMIEKGLYNKILLYNLNVGKKHLMLMFAKYQENFTASEFLCLYNIESKKISYYSTQIINDLNGGANVYPSELNSHIYINLSPYRFKNPDEETKKKFFEVEEGIKLKFPERKNEFRQLMEQSNMNDNPILQIITLKDDF